MNWEELIHNADFRFCDNGIINRVAIVEFLTSKVFGREMREVLMRRYELMSQHYNDDEYDVAHWQQDGLTIGDTAEWYHRAAVLDIEFDMFERGNPILNFKDGGRRYYNFGHDLPIWMRLGNCRCPRVMIVSQDPQRNPRDSDAISVSTPWAFHSSQYKTAICTRVRNLVASILAVDCEVYVTDYAKLYFTDQPKVTQRPEFSQRARIYNAIMGVGKTIPDVLQSEIEMVDPELIVTVGDWNGLLGRTIEGVRFNGSDPVAQPYGTRRILTIRHPAGFFESWTEYSNMVIRRIVDGLR